MKVFSVLAMTAAIALSSGASYSQSNEAEVPGDNFSLEGALELFKKSSSPEEFEKMLNSPASKVNNLDLNGDGYTDYIRVLDRNKGNVHAFTLQAIIDDDEVQDIAVIELEKLSDGKAVLQIVGDEDIYGVTTIIEPTTEVRTYAGTQTSTTYVNVWAWPSVRYIYSPHYTVWVSPWSIHYQPVWWVRWRPVSYVHYHPIWRPYHRHYVVSHTRRVVHAHELYRPYRRTSVVVHNRYHDNVVRYRNSYQDGYRRNDGRTYARDDRSRTRSDYNRNENNRRSSVQPNTTSTSQIRRDDQRSRTSEPSRVSTSRSSDGRTRVIESESSAPRRQTVTTPSNTRTESPTKPSEVRRRSEPSTTTVPRTREVQRTEQVQRSRPVERTPSVQRREQTQVKQPAQRVENVKRGSNAGSRREDVIRRD